MKKVASKNINVHLLNLLRSFLLMIGILVLDSCDKAEIGFNEGDGESSLESVVFSVKINPGIATRDEGSYDPGKDFSDRLSGDCQISSGKEINVIYYKAFEVENNALKESDTDPLSIEVNDINNTKITLTLDRTKAYKILFWAQHDVKGEETFRSPYSLSPAMEVTVNYDDILNNDERLDAFFGSLDYEWKKKITPTTVSLHRPFAQVNVGSIIVDWLPSGFYSKSFVSSKLTISNVASKFNIAIGRVIRDEGLSKYDVVFNFNPIFTGPTQDLEYLEPEEREELAETFKNAFLYVDFNENGKIDSSPYTTSSDSPSSEKEEKDNNSLSSMDWWRYERSRYIAMAYFLVDSEEELGTASDVVDVRFNIGYEPEEDDESDHPGLIMPFSEKIFDNVSVRPNYRTNIVGSLFTKQQRIFVNLSPLWDGVFTNRDQVTGFDDTNRLVSKAPMTQNVFDQLTDAFNKARNSEIDDLQDLYGFFDDVRGVKGFVLSEDVAKDDILQIHWDYILYGNGHSVKLHKYDDGGNYYKIGPVRNIYIRDFNANDNKDTIYVDDNGYVWFLTDEGNWSTQWNQLNKLDGSQNRKSYEVYCSDGRVRESNYYPIQN